VRPIAAKRIRASQDCRTIAPGQLPCERSAIISKDREMVMARTFTTLLIACVLSFVASAASAQSLRGTAATFWTTAPGVSNQSATPECDNCGVFVDTGGYQAGTNALASTVLESPPPKKQQGKKPRSGNSVSGNISAR
jgi:hypothetical protein